MRLILLGSGEFGIPTFDALRRHHDIAAVITQPDRPAGRKQHLTPTPVAEWAATHKLRVLKQEDVNEAAFIKQVGALKADASVVIAFGQKLSPALVDALGKLAINLHASLLPKYRGAAPIARAILEGEHETGVSIIGIAQRMDAGDIYAKKAMPIDPMQTAGELHDALAQLGPDVVQQVLNDLKNNALQSKKQNEKHVTQAPKLSKTSDDLSFEGTAESVRAHVHGLTPWPGVTVSWWKHHEKESTPLILLRVKAHTDYTHDVPPGTVINENHVATRDGAVELVEVQLPGGKPMTIDAFTRGHKLLPGDKLIGKGDVS